MNNLLKTHMFARVTVIALLFASFALSTNAFADSRDSIRSTPRDEGRALTPPPAPPATPPVSDPVPPPPPPPSGGINNTTSGEAGSGGNQGGNVVTGDESVDVHAVNEGPTNTNNVVTVTTGGITPPPPPPPAPTPESTCDPRSRDCGSGVRGR